MIGNELNTFIRLMTAATTKAGRSSGSVIERYPRHQDAPSILAASDSSPGITCSPASRVYVVNGSDTNTATPIIQANALSGRPSQDDWLELNWRSRPIWCRKMLIAPLSGCSIQRKISAVTITDAAHGAISAHRATRRPGKRWLKSWASPSESSIVMATTAITQITVRIRMLGRFGLWNNVVKFCAPAEPIVTPIGVMFCVDVWTMLTIGQSTTTAIRIRHGAIHGSGASRRQATPRRRGGRAARACGSAVCSTAVLSDMLNSPDGRPGSAAAGGGLLDRVEDLLRVTAD